MTKVELIKSLESFDDNQEVCVLNHKTEMCHRHQFIIQKVELYRGWYNDANDKSKCIIGIYVHKGNKQL